MDKQRGFDTESRAEKRPMINRGNSQYVNATDGSRDGLPATFSDAIDAIGMGSFQKRLILIAGMVRM